VIPDDPILRRMSELTVLTPDDRRAERVRLRCRAALKQPALSERRLVGPALLASIGLIYLSALVHDVLQLRRLF
jgi:hypothetical protein